MLKMSDRLTVPQIFFGEQHLGGARVFLIWRKTVNCCSCTKSWYWVKAPTTPELQKPSNNEEQNKKHVESLTEPPICFGAYAKHIHHLFSP